MVGLVLTVVLPLVALFFGTSVLGEEFEDGTAVYLLTKPVSRWQILFAKVAAAFTLTAALCVPATFIAGTVALGESSAIVVGFTVGVLAGSLAYTVLFVLLSVVTTRALIAGLTYAFLWEGAITGIFEGLRYLSVRHYAMGIAEAIADTPPEVFDAYVGGTTAIVLLVIVTATAAVLANQRLERIEVREPG
jgi:ABC-2 type transport system permease protein